LPLDEESIATTITGKTSNQPLVRMNKVPEATDEFPRVHRVGWVQRSRIQDAGANFTDGLRDLILTRSAKGIPSVGIPPQAACTLVLDAFKQSTESKPASIARIVQRRAAIQNCCLCPRNRISEPIHPSNAA